MNFFNVILCLLYLNSRCYNIWKCCLLKKNLYVCKKLSFTLCALRDPLGWRCHERMSDSGVCPIHFLHRQLKNIQKKLPKRHKITFTDFFINCSHLVEWPAQLNPSSWILTIFNKRLKNTSLSIFIWPSNSSTLYSNLILSNLSSFY